MQKVGDYVANVSNGLTEKMKAFCREYVRNNGNGTQAYLTAYDSKSETSASIEASKLLRRDDITSYIQSLNKPMENRIQNERERKRKFLWDIINSEAEDTNDRLRAMDLLNKMDQEYINITRDITHEDTPVVDLDTDALLRIVHSA